MAYRDTSFKISIVKIMINVVVSNNLSGQELYIYIYIQA